MSGGPLISEEKFNKVRKEISEVIAETDEDETSVVISTTLLIDIVNVMQVVEYADAKHTHAREFQLQRAWLKGYSKMVRERNALLDRMKGLAESNRVAVDSLGDIIQNATRIYEDQSDMNLVHRDVLLSFVTRAESAMIEVAISTQAPRMAVVAGEIMEIHGNEYVPTDFEDGMQHDPLGGDQI